MSSRRQRGEGSITQRHTPDCPPPAGAAQVRPEHPCRGSWAATIDLGYRGGKRRRKTVYAPTKAGVLKKLREAQKAAEAGDLTTAGTTVAAWLDYWLDNIAAKSEDVKPGTLSNYRSYVREYLKPCLGKVKLDKLTIEHVRDLHTYVMDKPLKRPRSGKASTDGHSSTTARSAHRILSKALNDAIREGILLRNVTTLVKAPRVAASRRRPLSMPEVHAFFRQVEADRLASRWQAALVLGARQGECLGLRWDHVDLRAGTVDLAWQLQRIRYRHGCAEKVNGWACGKTREASCPARVLDAQKGFDLHRLDGNLCLIRPKTEGSTRLIALPLPMIESLRLRYAAYLSERSSYDVDHGLVWCRPDGRPIDGRQDWKEWKAHLVAAGIPELTLHEARHTAATVLAALKTPERIIMSILGHSDAVTTRMYAHVDLTQQRAAMEEAGATLLLPAGAV